MKKAFLIFLFCFLYQFCHAQFGASIHQSNLPFVGLSYEIKERLLPELRIGTDNYFDDTSLELALTFIFMRDEIVNAYAGLGARIQILEGAVVPIGMNIYPFEKKNFGFQMELAGLVG
ncbi:MAG: hypothetical protein RIG62_11360, partial [Cyclobacteriaceae bacterium]